MDKFYESSEILKAKKSITTKPTAEQELQSHTNTKYPISVVCSFCVIILCSIFLVGLPLYNIYSGSSASFNIAFLSKFSTMNAATLLVLMALGIALFIASKSSRLDYNGLRITGLVIICLLLSMTVWIGLECILNINSGIETLIHSNSILNRPDIYTRRSSLQTVISCFMLSTALLFCYLKSSQYQKFMNFLVYMGMIIPYITLFDYFSLLSVTFSQSNIPQTEMSPILAFYFLLIGIGIMDLSPNQGLIGLLKSTTSAGELVRIKIPLAICIPLLLSYWFNHQTSSISNDIVISWGYASIFMIALIIFGNTIILKRDQEKILLIESIQNAEKKLRKIVESAPDAMVIVNSDGIINMVNNQTEKLFGYNQQDLYNKTIEILIPDKFQASHADHRNRYVQHPTVRNMGVGLELYGKHKNGHEFPVEVSLSPINVDEESWICAAIRDITDRKNKELEILKLNKELQSFTYSVSHDLRAPLRSIHGYTKILEEDYGDKLDDEGKTVLNTVLRNATRMGTLIDDLLAFSRLGRQSLQKQSIDTNTLVHAIIKEISQNQPNIKNTWKISKNLPIIFGDHTLIQQVFINLLSNAVKYSSKAKKPAIEVGFYREPNHSIFFVKDNGVGFDMKYQNKLFQVFQRLHNIKDFEGTGVGLAIVKLIVDKHGGKVWAEGMINKGATFYFSIRDNNN